jgi:hypothetical protein
VRTDVPFGEVSPVAFLLRLIEMGVEIDDVLGEEAFAKFTGLKFLSCVTTLELPVLLLANVPSDLG